MSAAPALAPDAAMVLGIAATAIPFARTPEDEAERWLRVLRLHGEVGTVLQSLGVSEDSITMHPENGHHAGATNAGAGAGTDGERRDVIELVGDSAARIAITRGAGGVATTDVLMALLQVYGPVFERALRAHGTDADEVLERLAAA
ncbi:MAG TPA: hypothetical protein VHW67_05865 [Solirubrobacteraceae bacterium]|jgi:hypothetical protein|nr:hypothetical protein [Solirubrobacteraceae bacterium]